MKSIVNPKDIDQLIKKDELFEMINEKYGVPPDWSRPPGFVSLARIILEQQVSLASADAHFNKLNNYLKDFTPENILSLSDEEMRDCQISRQKTKYLRALSTAFLDGEIALEEMPDLNETEVRNQLTSIKGIGNWTADIYLMFCLQAKDIFPIGDIAIVNTMKELTEADSKVEMIKCSENWKPFRSLASYFLWYYYLRKRNRQVINNWQ